MSSEIKGNSALILGYGREGRSTFKFLRKKFPNLLIAVADQNEIPEKEKLANVNYFSGKDYLSAALEFDTIIRSPGINTREKALRLAKEKGVHLTSATNIFFNLCQNLTIGITGTKGKGTTSTFLTELLKSKYEDVRLVGNIGHPALEELETATEQTIFVYELSSFQLEDCRYSPEIAILLNIYPEHIDFHKTFEDYIDAKTHITCFQSSTDKLIYNPRHQSIKTIVEKSLATKITYGEDFSLLDKHDFKLPGKANRENALAAISCAETLGVEESRIIEFISNIKPLQFRLEYIGNFSNIDFYNDSYATNQGAAVNAIEALDGPLETLIAGGYDRGIPFNQIANAITKSSLKNLILFPETGEKIYQIIRETNTYIQPHFVNSMEEAIEIAHKRTTPGKVCLLAPGCPSFGIFKDYKDRGEQFNKFVKEIGYNR